MLKLVCGKKTEQCDPYMLVFRHPVYPGSNETNNQIRDDEVACLRNNVKQMLVKLLNYVKLLFLL
jgi:hypothetical protein